MWSAHGGTRAKTAPAGSALLPAHSVIPRGVVVCRRPRRLGGGKGGESRAPRPPKDPKAQFVRRLIEKAEQ